MTVTKTAIDEAVAFTQSLLKAYMSGLQQELDSDELFFLASAYAKSFDQLLTITGWDIEKATGIVLKGKGY